MIIREDDFDVLTPEQAESKTPDKTPGDDQPSDQQGDSGDKPGITGGQSGQDAQDGKPGESSGQSGDQSSDDTIDLTGMTQEEFDELVKQIIAKSKEEDIDENETGLGGVITPEQSKHIQEELGIPVKTAKPEEIKRKLERMAPIYLEGGKGSGKGKGLFIRAIYNVLDSGSAWKDILKSFIGRAIGGGTEHSIINRRTLHSGIYTSSEKDLDKNLKGALIAVDTSGSVGAKELALMVSEIKSVIIQKKLRKSTVIYFDDGIQDIVDIRTPQDAKEYNPTPPGGGGTSFKEPYDKMVELWKNNYDVAIFFTDGDKSALRAIADKEPKFAKKWIWVIVDDPTWKAPWGHKVVHVSKANIERMMEEDKK